MCLTPCLGRPTSRKKGLLASFALLGVVGVILAIVAGRSVGRSVPAASRRGNGPVVVQHHNMQPEQQQQQPEITTGLCLMGRTGVNKDALSPGNKSKSSSPVRDQAGMPAPGGWVLLG